MVPARRCAESIARATGEVCVGKQAQLRRGYNVAAVALANKNAHVIWALLSRGDDYRPTGKVAPGPTLRDRRHLGKKHITMVVEVVSSMMGDRSDRRFPNLICTKALEAVSADQTKARGFPSGPGAVFNAVS